MDSREQPIEKIEYIDTNGISKYSNEYLHMCYIEIRKLYTCGCCKKVYNKDMVYGLRTKGVCYHCVVANLDEKYLLKDAELLYSYISKCLNDHDSDICKNKMCILCRYRNGYIKKLNNCGRLKILI